MKNLIKIIILTLLVNTLNAQVFSSVGINVKSSKYKITGNVEDNTASKLAVQSSTNEINWITKANLIGEVLAAMPPFSTTIGDVLNNGANYTWANGYLDLASNYVNGNMKRFHFNTFGDGVEFPSAQGGQFYMNPEEGFGLSWTDGTSTSGINIVGTTGTIYGGNMGLYLSDNSATLNGDEIATRPWVTSQISGLSTNLNYTASTRLLESSSGTDVNLPLVDVTNAGLMSSTDKVKLDGLSATVPTLQQVTSVGAFTENDFGVKDNSNFNLVRLYNDGGTTGAIEILENGSPNYKSRLNPFYYESVAGNNYIRVDAFNGIQLSKNTTLGTIKFDNLTGAAKNWQQPNASGTYALRVNGQAADVNGDITVSTGGSTTLSYSAPANQLTATPGNSIVLPLVNGTNDGLMAVADKAKVDGIAAGAEVNVNADWNAVTGDAQILNKPIVPTATSQLTNDSDFAVNANVIHTTGAETKSGVLTLNNTLKQKGGFIDLEDEANPTFFGKINFNDESFYFKDTNGANTFSAGQDAFAMYKTTGQFLTHDISGLTLSRTATWQNSNGTVAWTSQIPTTVSQLTNDSGFLTSVPAQSFASLTGKPTTLSGYGITDAYPLSGNPSGFLTSYTETDPVVKAINGIVKSNGTTISTAVSGTDYAPATSGSSILKANGAGGFSNATSIDINNTFGSQPNALFYATPNASAGTPSLRSLVASDIPTITQSQVTNLTTDLSNNATNDRNRTNHTGTQTSSTISDFNTAVDTRIGATSINALSDVVITTPSTGQVLKYNGTNWINDTDNTGAGGGSPSGNVGSIQYNDSGAFNGATNTEIENGNLRLESLGTSTPTTPAASGLNIFARDVAGGLMPAFVDPNGLDSTLQTFIARNKIGWWSPPGNATTAPGVIGFTAFTTTGTATARNVATTNFFTRMRRLGYVSTATAGSLAGARVAVAQITLGTQISGINVGGFRKSIRFGCSDAATVAGARQFVGISSSTAAPTNVEPSTLTNVIGIGHGASDTNLKIYYGGSAAQTPIDLGVNFPANTLSVDVYELTLFCAPNSTSVGYFVKRLNTGHIASGILTGTVGTQLPAVTTLLTYSNNWRSNNATALAVGLDIFSDYIETDQ